MAKTYHYVNQACVHMREANTHRSKVVSQALFGEKINLYKEKDGWSYIETPDGYFGWITSNSYVACETPYETSCRVERLAAHLYANNDIEFGPVITLPYGSELQLLDDLDSRWVKALLPDLSEYYIQKGDLSFQKLRYTKSDLTIFSQKFLGLPYTWGGRSSFGYDCSGFVQMLYGHLGIHLHRDARQQILDPRFKNCSVDDVQPGDLLFFGKDERRIMHVALSLGQQRMQHATSRENQPWIRISNLTDFEWSGNAAAYYPFRIGRQLSV